MGRPSGKRTPKGSLASAKLRQIIESTNCLQKFPAQGSPFPTASGDCGVGQRESGVRAEGGLEAELAVLVLMLVCGQHGLYDIPVLGDLATLYAEEVVEGHGLAGEAPFTYGEYEVTLTEDLVHTAVDHRYPLLGHSLEGSSQPREAIGDGGIVLDVLVSLFIAQLRLIGRCGLSGGAG